MALILYPNGVTETYKPNNLVFTEQELVELYSEFKEIKTCRVIPILNTWCVYGIKDNFTPMDYNKISSEITREDIHFHALFIHDSEVDNSWNVTDNVLYSGYNDFMTAMKKLIDEVAIHIMNQLAENPNVEQNTEKLPMLISLGTTKDNKVVFGFNLEEQNKQFFDSDNFYEFAKKVYLYISTHKQTKSPFTIYSDKNALVIIQTEKVKAFLDSLLEKFKSKEEYEICTNITNIIQLWETSIATPKKKRKPRTPKDKTNEQ